YCSSRRRTPTATVRQSVEDAKVVLALVLEFDHWPNRGVEAEILLGAARNLSPPMQRSQLIDARARGVDGLGHGVSSRKARRQDRAGAGVRQAAAARRLSSRPSTSLRRIQNERSSRSPARSHVLTCRAFGEELVPTSRA